MTPRKYNTEEIQRLSTEEFKAANKIPLTIILDNIRSLHNIGSVFRTADAYCIEKIILCGITATPPHAEIHKSALGAENSVLWEYHKDTIQAIEDLKKQNYHIAAIEQAEGSIMIHDFPFNTNTKYAVILGNEVKGVQQSAINASHSCIELPQYGTKHSLNVSVTAGIVIWEFQKALIQNP